MLLYVEFICVSAHLNSPIVVLSLDVMDISGEIQRDITHNILKIRLDKDGNMVPNSYSAQLQNDLDKINQVKQKGYCGSCYGGLEPEGGCCNTCEDVRMAYVNRGWSFSNPDAIEQVRKFLLSCPTWMKSDIMAFLAQCKNEGWAEKLQEQADEGCSVTGRIRVNKVIGNIHLSPGRSFQSNSRNLYELVPYLRDDGNKHDFSHIIHHFGFEGEVDCSPSSGYDLKMDWLRLGDDEYDYWKAAAGREMKNRLGLAVNPLDGAHYRTSKAQYMFQYFLKVVSTQFRTMDGKTVCPFGMWSCMHYELTEDHLGQYSSV